MSVFSKLKFITAKSQRKTSPIIIRRSNLCSKINEQIALVTAQSTGQTYLAKRMKWIKNSETGERTSSECSKRVKEWFWTSDSGKINLSLRYGTTTLLLNSKGANAIELTSASELLPTLTLLMNSVESGELDDAINNASAKLRAAFAK